MNYIKSIFLLFLTFTMYAVNGACEPAEPLAIEQLILRIDANDFDEGKLTEVKEFLENHCLSTTQLANVLQKFSFEEDKINVIKAALDKLSDPANIETVLAELEFESSKNEIRALLK